MLCGKAHVANFMLSDVLVVKFVMFAIESIWLLAKFLICLPLNFESKGGRERERERD